MIEFLTTLLVVFTTLSLITIFWKRNSSISVISTFGSSILFFIFTFIDFYHHSYTVAVLDILVAYFVYVDSKDRLKDWYINELLK